MIVTYPGWFAVAAGASALVGRRERRIPAQFRGGALVIIERPHPGRPHRHPAAAEVVDTAESAAKHIAGRVGLHQTVGRGEEIRAAVLGEDVRGLDGGRPERGRRRLISRCRLICNERTASE